MNERDDAPSDAPKLKSCGCGTTRADKMAQVEREYSFFGTLYLLWGGTSVPTEVRFRCIRCQQVFDSSRAPSVLRNYVL